MSIAIQNIPFFCLVWIGVGFVFIIFGILKIASQAEDNNHYVEFSHDQLNKDYNKEVEELFSYFLEEEEKKNQDLRGILLEASDEKVDNSKKDSTNAREINNDKEFIKDEHSQNANKVSEIVKLYNEGVTPEEIAKKLEKGVGEVNLMISLYTMR